jgi:release factor glutamine methyltransferase
MSLAGVDRAHLYLMLPEPLPAITVSRFRELVERRAAGEPVAYITGFREFMGLDFAVDQRVLIPRPETEGLVERALTWLSSRPGPTRIVDVGTGSGAIALSLARHVPTTAQPVIVASDVSIDALAVTRLNRERLSVGSVELVCGSLLDWSHAAFDLIMANLPYLREEQRHSGISWEPDAALYAADGGFALYARLLRQSGPLLAPGGMIVCEIDPDQREQALSVARRAIPSADVRIEADLAGIDRYLIVEDAEG